MLWSWLGRTLELWLGLNSSIPRCKCLPGDLCWPNSDEWDAFNASVSGRLIATLPLASQCHDPHFDDGACEKFQQEWLLPPVRTRPTPHLRTLDKSMFARLLQCRTGHAFTGEYNRAIDKPERGFACTCGVPLQTRDHLLVGCPDLERYRAPLRNVSPMLIVADLLGTREGLAAIVKFLKSSGAFMRPAGEEPHQADD